MVMKLHRGARWLADRCGGRCRQRTPATATRLRRLADHGSTESGAAESGFTLLELIVATALMGMVIVGLLTLITLSLSNAAEVKQYDRAAMLARTEMNRLLVEEPLPVGVELHGEYGADSGWEAKVEPFERFGPQGNNGFTLERIALTIWWRKGAERKSIEVEGFRAIRR